MRRAALALTLLLGCGDPTLVIVADVSKNCNEVAVDLVVDSSGVGVAEILDAAATPTVDGDLAGTSSVWLLVRIGGDTIAVRHVVDGVVATETVLPPPSASGSLSLRAAPDADEVFVMFRGSGSFRIWRVDPTLDAPGYQSSHELAAFPHDAFTCAACDTDDWHRDLLFLDGRPFVVSVPPLSESSAVSVWLGALGANPVDTGMLGVGTEHRLNFERMCFPTFEEVESDLCEANKQYISYPSITVLGRQHDPRPSYARVLIHRERAEEGIPATFPDIFVVTLELDPDGIPKGVLRSYQGFDDPVADPPSGLVVDRFATYVMYTGLYAAPSTRLLRLPAPTADFEDITDALLGLLLPDSDLLPLDEDVGLGRVADGNWEITKLFPDDLSQSQVTFYEPARPIARVDPVGPGFFLLHHDEGRPDVARVRCVEPAFDDDLAP